MLKLQPSLSRAVGQACYATVVAIAASIEHHFRDALCLRALGQLCTKCLRAIFVRADFEILLLSARRGQGLARRIVDNLRRQMLQAADTERRGLSVDPTRCFRIRSWRIVRMSSLVLRAAMVTS